MTQAANSPQPISYGRRIAELAAQQPDLPAIIFAPQADPQTVEVSWQQLDRQSNRLARLLQEQGVGYKTTLVVGLPNSPVHFFVTLAGWKLGAMVLPLRWEMPAAERDKILAVAQPGLIVADWEGVNFPIINQATLNQAQQFSDTALPDIIPDPGRAIASGGSTGLPKIIVEPRAFAFVPVKLAEWRRGTGGRATLSQFTLCYSLFGTIRGAYSGGAGTF